jgi:hypothetical protein
MSTIKIHIYYRHAVTNILGRSRPQWFSYENCFKNLLSTIEKYDNINLTLALDGDINQDFTKNYQDKFTLFPTNHGSSLLSYRTLLGYIKEQFMESNELIYFLENDYLHVDNWVEKIIELYSTFSNLNYISLYDHNDKYFLPAYDNLVSKIITTENHHWRTTPSTCGSFIINRKIFEEDYDVWFNAVGDHNTFLHLNENRHRFVLTPIPGLSTHCMEGLLSPTIKWKYINNKL